MSVFVAGAFAVSSCGGRSSLELPIVVVEWADAAAAASGDNGSTSTSPGAGAGAAGTGGSLAQDSAASGQDGSPSLSEGGAASAGSSPAPDLGDATSFLENTAHTGYVDDPSLEPPLASRWSLDLGVAVSYPLVVQGRVYVLATSSSGGSTLVAIDAQSGTMLWQTDAGQAFAHAYDGQKIFTVTPGGLLASFDAATGAPGWSTSLPDQYSFSSAPTAYRGIVYVGGAGGGGTVYATDERNGDLLWTQSVANGDDSAPTVDDSGVYVAYACVQAYAFDRISGTPMWHHEGPCEGGGGATTVLSNGVLYARDFSPGNLALYAASGTAAGSFTASVPPAFDATKGFFGSSGTLSAEVAASRAVLWSFAGDGQLASAPLVVGDHVYVGSTYGALYAVNVATGTADWSESLAGTFGFSEGGGRNGGASLAAAHGLLVVPIGGKLIGYARASEGGDGGDAAKGD